MKSSSKIVYAVIICFALMIATGCTTKQVKHSGFLENYPEFKSGPKGGADLVYLKDGVDFSVYNKIMMDHVVFYFSDDSRYKGIHPEELSEFSETFHKAVVESLGETFYFSTGSHVYCGSDSFVVRRIKYLHFY
ncbi:MAG TPA: DUF3313 family protein [bacterium]|nr:DUF3313 family protein [bacterium]